jgi:cytochrome b
MTVVAAKPGASGRGEVKVWDPLVRVLHWTLVVAFAVAFATGDEVMVLHRWAGYTILGIVAVRLVWGVVGTRHARFTDFVRGPSAVKAYLKGLIAGRPKHYVGHNPAGGAMVLALVAGLLLTAGTGLLADRPGAAAEVFEDVHEVVANLMLALVGAHVLGVLVSSVLHRENLVRAMITGFKRAPTTPDASDAEVPRSSRLIGGAMALVLIVTASGAAVAAMSDRLGFAQAAPSQAYVSACGECHDAHHPSLLPASSWRAVMATLSDHFGDDASLNEETATTVTSYLVTNAADVRDTIPAYRFRKTAADEPRRVTATAYWKRIHADLDESVFRSRAVGSKVNCAACHRDAARGGFHESNIEIPGGDLS